MQIHWRPLVPLVMACPGAGWYRGPQEMTAIPDLWRCLQSTPADRHRVRRKRARNRAAR